MFPLACRSVLACSRRLTAASCYRRKRAFCCFEKDSSTAVAIFVLTLALESCFVNACDMLEKRRTRLGGEKGYKRSRAGISNLCGVMEKGAQSLGRGTCEHNVRQMPDNIPE